ncbi:MAG: trigger factor, partial [Candidatus Zixiibacteriota bacterium]
MKVEIKELENLFRELSVQIPSDTVNSKMEEMFRDVRNKVTLKGYRKGKAPLDMIKSVYGDQVKADVAEEIIKSTYPEAIREKTLRVASYPSVTKLNFTDDGGLDYIAQVEVFPEIEKVRFDKLKLTSAKIEINDKEIDEVIEVIQKRQSELKVVERAVGDRDVVVVDIEKTYDPGNVLPENKFSDSEVDLCNKLTVKEFKEQLPGMKVGGVREIEVKYDKDYPDKVFAGAHLKYKCTVKSVKERILPELNDAFAKATGEVETLLELRIKTRDSLEKQKIEEQ